MIEVKVEKRRFVDELLYPRYSTSTSAPLRSDLPVIRSMYLGQDLTHQDIARIILGELPIPEDPSAIIKNGGQDPNFSFLDHLRMVREQAGQTPLGTPTAAKDSFYYDGIGRINER